MGNISFQINKQGQYEAEVFSKLEKALEDMYEKLDHKIEQCEKRCKLDAVRVLELGIKKFKHRGGEGAQSKRNLALLDPMHNDISSYNNIKNQ